MIPMPMVRPTLEYDLTILENQFSRGYDEGTRIFYVSIADEQGQTATFTEEEKSAWGPLWNSTNDEFNSKLKASPVLKHLVDSKFFVCDGNHRRITWMRHIQRLHSADKGWHVSVDSIILDTRHRIGVAMQAMHDNNKYVTLNTFSSSFLDDFWYP